MLTVRPYAPPDRAAVAQICVRTGDNGGDASGRYSSDRLLPLIYAEPYLEFEPELAFVVDHAGQPVGYILGTSNTANFAQWYRQVWIPRTATELEEPSDSDSGWLWTAHQNPERLVRPELADYPAHLHIDLLPAAQGSGMGRILMQTLLSVLSASGVPAVHLAMSSENVGAGHFYRRLGFSELAIDEPGTTFFGRTTS